MNTRGLPGMLAPRYQELQVGRMVGAAVSLTWATQASWASGRASIRRKPFPRR